jgi:hypothetical protein
LKNDGLWAPYLLRTINIPLGRMAFEVQRERLVIDCKSGNDQASRLDELSQEVRMSRFAILS